MVASHLAGREGHRGRSLGLPAGGLALAQVMTQPLLAQLMTQRGAQALLAQLSNPLGPQGPQSPVWGVPGSPESFEGSHGKVRPSSKAPEDKRQSGRSKQPGLALDHTSAPHAWVRAVRVDILLRSQVWRRRLFRAQCQKPPACTRCLRPRQRDRSTGKGTLQLLGCKSGLDGVRRQHGGHKALPRCWENATKCNPDHKNAKWPVPGGNGAQGGVADGHGTEGHAALVARQAARRVHGHVASYHMRQAWSAL